MTLILVVFALVVLSSLALVMVSMLATTSSASRSHLRVTQAFYLGDAGLSRVKEIMDDDPAWRPSSANCSAYGMSHGTDGGVDYCRQSMTLGSGVVGHYDIFVEEVGGGNVDVKIKSAMDVSED